MSQLHDVSLLLFHVWQQLPFTTWLCSQPLLHTIPSFLNISILNGQFPSLCQLEFKCYDILNYWQQETKICCPCHPASVTALGLFSFSQMPPSPLQRSQRTCGHPPWRGFRYFLFRKDCKLSSLLLAY